MSLVPTYRGIDEGLENLITQSSLTFSKGMLILQFPAQPQI